MIDLSLFLHKLLAFKFNLFALSWSTSCQFLILIFIQLTKPCIDNFLKYFIWSWTQIHIWHFYNHCNVQCWDFDLWSKMMGTKQIDHKKSSPKFSSSRYYEKKEENITELWGKNTQQDILLHSKYRKECESSESKTWFSTGRKVCYGKPLLKILLMDGQASAVGCCGFEVSPPTHACQIFQDDIEYFHWNSQVQYWC